MTLAFIAIIFGLALLIWSADRFMEGSASTKRQGRHAAISALGEQAQALLPVIMTLEWLDEDSLPWGCD